MRRLIREERGATIVIIAMVLVVLLGLVGLAVDAGALYKERRELRNGADAAVLGIAEDCALGARPCTDTVAADTAGVFADLNAKDGASGVESIDLDLTAQTVRVVTNTEVAATGSNKIEPFFMQLLGIGGTTVRGAATAQWGVPASLDNVLPLMISSCEWPDTPIPYTTTLYLHGQDTDGTLACNALPGHDMDGDGSLPGGFGWLETEAGCTLDIALHTWVPNEPGVAVPQACKDMIQVGNTVWVPWFDDADGVEGTGNGSYFVSGFGAFLIESYKFPGWSAPDASGVFPCSGPIFCIRGTFTTASTDIGEFGTGQSYGIVLIKLID